MFGTQTVHAGRGGWRRGAGGRGLPAFPAAAPARAGEAAAPALSEAALNAIIPAGGSELRRLAAEVRRDLRAFVRERFTLSPLQERRLEALTAGQVAEIHRALDMALAHGYRIRVRLPGTGTRRQIGRWASPRESTRVCLAISLPKGDAGWTLTLTLTVSRAGD
jgi:hypothetical protein